MKELQLFTWKNHLNPCFLEVQAPFLTSLQIWLEDDRTVVPWKVFEALPALVELSRVMRTDQNEETT